jgi:rRNA maturation endonuclease Nob1|tara:strand:- start:486 stop:950 length:465 start_codon:yes stop_codon:yes gene_type:complete
MEVLDTAALLTWPVEMLINGLCASSQLSEVERLSPARHLLIESQGPRFVDPTPSAIQTAKNASQQTGDFAGLSNVDLDVLALALSGGHRLVTDDYRMQNVCESLNHPWRGVIQSGVEEVREHVLVCAGCDSTHSQGETCPDCGAPLILRRKKTN